MAARRDKTAQRAWQASPVAKRRPQKPNRNMRHRNNRRQQHRDQRKMFVLRKKKERLDHRHRRERGGAAAAQCDAGGVALMDGSVAAQWTGAVTVHSMFCTSARREPGVRECERRRRDRC